MDFVVGQFESSKKAQMTIAIGCTGGLHRSVYITERLGQHLRQSHPHVNIEHRDLHRNRVERDAAEEQS